MEILRDAGCGGSCAGQPVTSMPCLSCQIGFREHFDGLMVARAPD